MMDDSVTNNQAREILNAVWPACDGKQAAAVFVAGANMCAQATAVIRDSGIDPNELVDWFVRQVLPPQPEVQDVG